MPKDEKMIPTNRIHVMPNEKFLIRKCSPAQRPRQTTKVSSTIDCVTEGCMNRSLKNDMFFVFSERRKRLLFSV